MLTTLRAALSVLLLAGFYLFALAVVGGLGVVAVLSFRHGSASVGVKLALAAVIAAVGLAIALGRVLRTPPALPDGLLLQPHEAPGLWATVRELAVAADTRPPDEIRLVAEVNAAVDEDARLLGLRPGPRRLYLGVPLLLGLDVAQLRSVIGHELGHYSNSHTRLGPITYRGRAAVLATVEQTAGTFVGLLLRQYAALFLLVSAAVSRRQEIEADAVSVRVAGREAARSALLEIPVLDAAWDFYQDAFIGPGWQVGLAPTADAVFTGFGELLHARADELTRMRAEGPARRTGSVWDSHPPIPERVAAIAVMPDRPSAPPDSRPAAALVPDARRAAAQLAGEVLAAGDRRRVEWPELTSLGRAAAEQRAADVVLRAAAQMTGGPWGSVATVLDVVAQGRGEELGHQIGVDPLSAASDGVSHPLADPLLTVFQAALVQAGLAGWRHSWSGATLVDRDGAPVDLAALAAHAVDPRAAVDVRSALAARGVDPDHAGRVDHRATLVGAQPVR